MRVNPVYNYAISQIFSPSLLKKIHNPIQEQNIKNLLIESNIYPSNNQWNLVEALEISYTYLKENYRCEYVYKNEIANQLLLKFHNDNSATLLKELPSDNAIADIVIINGSAVAYEIKTELDSFNRLSNQILSYQGLFERLYVVTHEDAVKALTNRVDKKVGIIILDSNGLLQTLRQARSNKATFNPSKAIFTIRQSELVTAYELYEGKLPSMGTALIRQYCTKWYLSLKKSDCQKIFTESLKSRKPSSYQFQMVKHSTPALKMLFLGQDISKKNCLTTCDKLSIFETV